MGRPGGRAGDGAGGWCSTTPVSQLAYGFIARRATVMGCKQ